jgi:ADP-ribose pyrophosphatase
MKFDLLKSETIYNGRAFTVRRDHLKTPSGNTVLYDIIEHHGSVIIVPIDHDGNIVFIHQYRHAAAQTMLELPAGTLEPDEDPLACAQRETREETGLEAAKLEKIGSFYLAPGYSTEHMHVYLARNLSHNPLAPDADEYLEVERIPIAEAFERVKNGQVLDAKTVAALLLAQPHLA